MSIEEIFRELGLHKDDDADLHVTRNFSSFVAVSNGKVIGLTDPWMSHCPMYRRLYGKIDVSERAELKAMITRRQT